MKFRNLIARNLNPMKKIIFLIALTLLCFNINAQQTKYDFSKEIDEQLWKSFVKSYNARDGQNHVKIHTKDVLRITTNGIKQGKAYRDQILGTYKKGQTKREIEFKFEHRIHAPDIAYEVGYFKVIVFRKDKTDEYYGRFSVVLKKEDGRWKIAQDWDIDEINGVKITKADYEKLESIVISKN